MIATKYAPAVLILVLLALVPTVIHSYVGRVDADHLTVGSIQPALANMSSVPTDRSKDWGRRRLESDDWFERTYLDGAQQVVLTVARSYDHKVLYHHPELAVSYHYASYDAYRVQEAPGRPGLPLHVLSNEDGGPVAVYVLHYDGRFIADPIRFQLRTALEQLVSGRKPMTLIYARDDSKNAVADLEKSAVLKVLLAAIDQFTGGSRP